MMVSQEKDSRVIEILLPNGNYEKVELKTFSTISDLKIACECCLGIPAELVKIFAETGKTDEELIDIDKISANSVRLEVPIWWNKCICNVLNNDIQSAFRRVQLPMQQVARDERVFVAMFMACCRRMHAFLSLLVKLETTVDVFTHTDSGRTLLHACAMGGSLKCLEIIVTHLLNGHNDSFKTLDHTKQSAVHLAQRQGHKEIAERLLQYIKDNEEKENLDLITNSPHQEQANQKLKINSESVVNERLVDKEKHDHESSDSTNKSSNGLVVDVDVMPTNRSNSSPSQMIDENVQCNSMSDLVSGVTPEHNLLTRKFFLRRVKEQNFNLVKTIVHDEENEKNRSFLPSLVTDYDQERTRQTASLPASPSRTSPVSDVIKYHSSAPNSPKSGRRQTFRAASLAARFAIAPTPPRIQIARNAGEKWNDYRRGSAVVVSENNRIRERKKSRSVCEVTLRESFGTLYKNMYAGPERIELPWNAWIAAKRQENSLPPTPEDSQLKAPQSPCRNRRRSFVQWLNDKDLDVLRRQHAEFHALEEEGTTGKRGKSFEEWLEDKHAESKKGKDKEKEKEEALKCEEENKMRRRRMSQQKYQSWLQAKELRALETEEKLLDEAKHKSEKMKLRWEEEDEMRKKTGHKVNVSRTKSCPTKNNSDISRQTFSSLNNK